MGDILSCNTVVGPRVRSLLCAISLALLAAVVFVRQAAAYNSVSYSPRANIFAVGVSDELSIYNSNNRLLNTVTVGGNVSDVEFSPDGRLLAVVHDLKYAPTPRWRVAIYQSNDLTLLANLVITDPPPRYYNALAFVSNSQLLIVQHYSTALWHWRTGKIRYFAGGNAVAVNSARNQIAISRLRLVELFNMPSGDIAGGFSSSWKFYDGGPVSYVWSDHRLAVMRGNRVEIWDPQERKRVTTVRYKETVYACQSLAARPNTSQFAVGCSGHTYLFDAETGTLVHKFNVGADDIAFSRGGRLMVTISGSPSIFDLGLLLKDRTSSASPDRLAPDH